MYFSYFLVYFGVIGASAADNNFRKALQLSDKICSVNFDPKEGRSQRVFETVTGFMLPSYLTTHDTSPYSGFKILKTYTFRPTSFRSETRLGVAFCGQGKVQWQTSTQLQDDIEWEKPFCIYNPDYGSQKRLSRLVFGVRYGTGLQPLLNILIIYGLWQKAILRIFIVLN